MAPILMNGQLPGRPFILVDYPDADFSAIVVDSTYVSPKVCCLSCQKSNIAYRETVVTVSRYAIFGFLTGLGSSFSLF